MRSSKRGKKMFKHALVTAVTLASLFAVQTAQAAGPAGIARGLKAAPAFSYISEKRRTTAPFAHVMFCAQNPSECEARGGASEISLNEFANKQLRSVNASVNRSILRSVSRLGSAPRRAGACAAATSGRRGIQMSNRTL